MIELPRRVALRRLFAEAAQGGCLQDVAWRRLFLRTLPLRKGHRGLEEEDGVDKVDDEEEKSSEEKEQKERRRKGRA